MPTRVLWLAALVACEPAPINLGIPPDPVTVGVSTYPVETWDLGQMADFDIQISPPPGTFVGEIEVTLSSSDPETTFVYTTDGGLPSGDQGIPYTGPITLTNSTSLRILAEARGAVRVEEAAFLKITENIQVFSSDMPVLVLWTRGEAPETKEEWYTPFSLVVFEPDPVTGATEWPGASTLSVPAGLRVRGSSSAGYPKRPYRLETWNPASPVPTDMDVELLGMPAEADWVLLAPLDFDRAFSRNALVYALSNQIGWYAPRTRFAEVFVAEQSEIVGGEDYVGVYVVVERIERDGDRLPLTRLAPTDLFEPEVTGGYIFKEDRTGPNETGFTAGTATGAFEYQQPFVYADPPEPSIQPEQQAYLITLLDELALALTQPNFTHPVTGRHYEDLIDVDSFIDHHILNVFAKNPDAFRLSGYFHKDRDGLLNAGPLWDFDRTMGCESDTRAADPTWWDATNETSDTTDVFDHGLWPGLFSDPAFRQRYWDRWAVLLATDLSESSVNAILTDFEDQLTEAAPRNFTAWSSYPPRGGSLATEMDLLTDWLNQRRSWIEGCLALPDPRNCTGQ